MANEQVGVEVLEQDILERAGVEKRDDLPITIECTWGGQTFSTGEPHPLIPGHLIFAIFQNPTEIKVYSLCPQTNGAPPKDPRAEMRTNPTRTTLVKTARSTVTEIMILDVFVASIVQDLRELVFETYGQTKEPQEIADQIAQLEPELLKELIDSLTAMDYRVQIEAPREPSPPAKPQAVPQQTGS